MVHKVNFYNMKIVAEIMVANATTLLFNKRKSMVYVNFIVGVNWNQSNKNNEIISHLIPLKTHSLNQNICFDLNILYLSIVIFRLYNKNWLESIVISDPMDFVLFFKAHIVLFRLFFTACILFAGIQISYFSYMTLNIIPTGTFTSRHFVNH